MAVSIMSTCCRASLLGLCLVSCFLQVFIRGEVFRPPAASNAFLRSKRANRFLVEEILPGNLERECIEELCSYEEAREYFEDTAKTNEFWSKYFDGDQCNPNPCLHGASCTDQPGWFDCACVAPYHGKLCELGGNDERLTTTSHTILPECPTGGPKACHQLCTVNHNSYTCSCMPGFKLQRDGQSCLPGVEFPCGRLPVNVNRPLCPDGKCPWQVKVVNGSGTELCGGVLLGPSSVLTAASCLYRERDVYDIFVVLGDGKRIMRVRAVDFHERFRAAFHDYDLAFLKLIRPLQFSSTLIHLCLPTKDFCENILMNSGTTGITMSPGPAQTQEVVYMTLDECRSRLNVSHPLSNKMFCMRRKLRGQNRAQERMEVESQPEENPGGVKGNDSKVPTEAVSAAKTKPCDHLLPGTPVATVDRGTVFLTGLLTSSSMDCSGSTGGLVFTKLSRHLSWIQPRLEPGQKHMTPQVNLFPMPLK